MNKFERFSFDYFSFDQRYRDYVFLKLKLEARSFTFTLHSDGFEIRVLFSFFGIRKWKFDDNTDRQWMNASFTQQNTYGATAGCDDTRVTKSKQPNTVHACLDNYAYSRSGRDPLGSLSSCPHSLCDKTSLNPFTYTVWNWTFSVLRYSSSSDNIIHGLKRPWAFDLRILSVENMGC